MKQVTSQKVKKTENNLTIVPLSLGIYALRPQVLT